MKDPGEGSPSDPSLVPDRPDQADRFHLTVGAEILDAPDAMTIAQYQHHSEIHVIYFLSHQRSLGHGYHYRRDPPRYIKCSLFEDVRDTVLALNMPPRLEDLYCSIVIGGGHFAGATGSTYRRYQEYTVELFGRKTEFPYRQRKRKWPYLSQSPVQPIYWHESPDDVIQIWRTRVFLCCLNKLAKSPSESMGGYFPYFQETWHPTWPSTSISLNRVEKLGSRISWVDFCSTAEQIRARGMPKIGRPGRFPTSQAFYEEVRKVFSELWTQNRSRPTQKEVAWKMSIKISYFKKLWGKTRRRWNDLTVE